MAVTRPIPVGSPSKTVGFALDKIPPEVAPIHECCGPSEGSVRPGLNVD